MKSQRRAEQATNTAQAQHRQPRHLSYGPDPLQFGVLHLPAGDGPHPVVILIHGGFWRSRYTYTLMTALAEDLATRGFAAWNIEYRRVGDAQGGWPNTMLDVARATDHLRAIAPTYALNLAQAIAIGHSAGGHLALWLAARHRIAASSILSTATRQASDPARAVSALPLKAAISQAGVADLIMAWQLHLSSDAVVELLGGSPATVPERYSAASPAALLPLGVPQALIHGTRDTNVPLSISQAYTHAAQAAGDHAQLIVLPGVDHFALIDPSSDAWRQTVAALQSLLRLP